MNPHLYLFYTIDDDGIWIACEKCVWMRNLGHHPTGADITEYADHECEVKS